jgi:putative colanic acid biosysnthesis UDP-glucose lipid carrier transferase
MQRRIEHDLYYIENWSFLFDLTIVARTIVSVLRGDKNAY